MIKILALILLKKKKEFKIYGKELNTLSGLGKG
jgi:hypothetical protein